MTLCPGRTRPSKPKLVDVEIDFKKKDLFKYMIMAHELDITFNEFVTRALEHTININKDGK